MVINSGLCIQLLTDCSNISLYLSGSKVFIVKHLDELSYAVYILTIMGFNR